MPLARLRERGWGRRRAGRADGSTAPGDASDAGTGQSADRQSDAPTGPYCDGVDAAYCEDFDHNHALAQIGVVHLDGDDAGVHLAIAATSAISPPMSLVATTDRADASTAASVTHDFAMSLGSFSSISVNVDFRCSLIETDTAGAPIGLIFTQDSQNYHQTSLIAFGATRVALAPRAASSPSVSPRIDA